MTNFVYIRNQTPFWSHRTVRNYRKLITEELRTTNQRPAKVLKNNLLQGIFGTH